MNELAKVQDNSWLSMKDKATMLVRSGFLPVAINTPEKAIAIALTGKELGIGMMESYRSINVIQGKPTVSPQLMLALANRTGDVEDIQIDSTDQKCTVTIKRKGRSPHTESFGIKEATDLQLLGKDNYKKQAKTMFKWRCLAACLRVTFPDVLLGLYTPDEMGVEVHVNPDTEEMAIPEPQVGIRLSDVINSPKPPLNRTPEPLNEVLNLDQEPDESPLTEAELANIDPNPAFNVKYDASQDTRTITEKQAKLLFVKTKLKGISHEALREHMIEYYRVDTTKDLTRAQFQELLNWLENEKVA